MDNIIGIVPARKGSRRLKDKNIQLINDTPLIERAYFLLESIEDIGKVYLSTDYPSYIASRFNMLERSEKSNTDSASLQEVIDDAITDLGLFNKEDVTIVLLMCTNPFMNKQTIERAIELYRNTRTNILRSYSSRGEENGLYIFGAKWFTTVDWLRYDTYTSAIIAPGHEIHTPEDLEKAKKLLATG